MSSSPLHVVHTVVWIALLAALTAAGAFIHVPLGPVPISLQTLFVLLCGFALGPLHGALAVGLYLVAGFIGLPVFSGGAAGLGHLFGPTGGYLVGFIPCAALGGLAVRKLEPGQTPAWKTLLFWGGLGFAVLYVLGVLRLAMVLDMDLVKAASVGMLPFLPGDALKLVAACGAARLLHARRLLRR